MLGPIPLSKRSEKSEAFHGKQTRDIIVSLYTPRYENPSIRSLFINATSVFDA